MKTLVEFNDCNHAEYKAIELIEEARVIRKSLLEPIAPIGVTMEMYHEKLRLAISSLLIARGLNVTAEETDSRLRIHAPKWVNT